MPPEYRDPTDPADFVRALNMAERVLKWVERLVSPPPS